MRFYVASKACEREKVHEICTELEEMGHVVTHDWTLFDLSNMTKDEISDQVWSDILGVCKANLLVLYMMNPHTYQGAWVELGAALGKCIPVVVIGHGGDDCPFLCLASRRFDTLEQFYEWMKNES